jgi:dTDP-4-dehydrorhamnose reductase
VKILVLGSTGQLGLEVQEISKTTGKFSWIFSNLNDLNISELSSIDPYLKKINPSIIINCAAYTNVDKAELEPKLADLINHKAVDVISKWTSLNKKKLIHVSTDYVFDGLDKNSLTETSKTNPLNEYGLSKLRGELACLKNDSQSIIIRTSWLYSSNRKNFVKTMIELMKKNKQINVVNDQFGSPTYAYDLANLIIKIIINFKWYPGLYHYSNIGKISWLEFARSIKELYGLSSTIIGVSSEKFQTIAKRPKYSYLNKSKIKNIYNIQIPYYTKSLKKCIEILKHQS